MILNSKLIIYNMLVSDIKFNEIWLFMIFLYYFYVKNSNILKNEKEEYI